MRIYPSLFFTSSGRGGTRTGSIDNYGIHSIGMPFIFGKRFSKPAGALVPRSRKLEAGRPVPLGVDEIEISIKANHKDSSMVHGIRESVN